MEFIRVITSDYRGNPEILGYIWILRVCKSQTLNGANGIFTSNPSVRVSSIDKRNMDMGVSKNSGSPKSSILIGFGTIINHPFWGKTPYFWKHPYAGLWLMSYTHPGYPKWWFESIESKDTCSSANWSHFCLVYFSFVEGFSWRYLDTSMWGECSLLLYP